MKEYNIEDGKIFKTQKIEIKTDEQSQRMAMLNRRLVQIDKERTNVLQQISELETQNDKIKKDTGVEIAATEAEILPVDRGVL